MIIDYRRKWIPKPNPPSLGGWQPPPDVNGWQEHQRQQSLYHILADLPKLFSNAKFVFFDDLDFIVEFYDYSGCRPFLLSFRGCECLFDEISTDQAGFVRETIYLDLSRAAIRNCHGLSKYHPDLTLFPNLRVLKLQGVGLKDADLREILRTSTFRLQLSSLDIRDNSLTDEAFADMEQRLAPCLDLEVRTENMETSYFEDPPIYTVSAPTGEEQEDVVPDITHLPPDNEEAFMQQARHHKNATDIIPRTGLTALYLSGNSFTSDTFLRFFHASNRLQAFDLDVEFRASRFSKSLSDSRLPPQTPPPVIATAINLISALHSRRLETLRVHHSLVTHSPAGAALHLLPDTNPRLRALTLVGLPATCPPATLARLTAFLRAAAAQEAALARARALVDGCGGGGRRGAKVLPGLRSLRLEIEDRGAVSVSGDADADEFAARSRGDFSFFAEDEGEGVALRDGLRRFRAGTREAFERAGRGEVPVGGPHYHWTGRLEVVWRAGEEE